MIAEAIREVNSKDHYNVGHYVEFAKGSKELITTWADFKRKIKRVWRLRSM